MKAWRWLGLAALICSVHACGGDDDNGDDDSGTLMPHRDAGRHDAGDDEPDTGMKPDKPKVDSGKEMEDASAKDAEPDAFDPFNYDANGIFDHDYDAGPPPAGWTCAEALWADGYCDCGCSALDVDCTGFSCQQPGCIADRCEACFDADGAWRPCTADPNPDDWTCGPQSRMNDSLCDCGCGIPDPDCDGSGCTEPGCRKVACDTRNGCGDFVTADNDDCSSINPSALTQDWTCAWDHYGSGDGCDCGCGTIDPDCLDKLSCTGARCFADQCDRCSDENGRPYSCDAAQQGWDDDTDDTTLSKERSACNSTHFDADDGCDCGCGGRDPDCGNDGCDEFGCSDSTCDRCTDSGGNPTGCAPSAWLTAGCDARHYGTGDGCDCGCGARDPDCGSKDGCTAPGCGDDEASCDACWDTGGAAAQPIACKAWTCAASAFADGTCDCGCGAPDVDCRETNRFGCEKAGCETAACERCEDNGELVSCGGTWSGAYTIKFYGLDGLCDCGGGASDPDCGKGEGCKEPGCNAPGCEVCQSGNLAAVCLEWTCSAKHFGTDDGCDCGCGAPDPDCNGGGCNEPGCKAEACEACYDPYGRAVRCAQ
jgi:hypothetical protein